MHHGKNHPSCASGVAYFQGKMILSRFENGIAAYPEEAEAKAICLATQIAKTMEWKKISLLSDAQHIIHAILL